MFGQPSILPASGSIRFMSRRCSGNASGSVPSWYTSTVPLSDPMPGLIGVPGTTKWFHDRALALFDVGDPDPTNQSTLDTLASKVFKDYCQWNSVSFDEVFAEILAPTPDGLTDLIEWTYRPRDASTRRMSPPYNADPEELYHHDPINANCKDSGSVVVTKAPCFESYSPVGAISGGSTTLKVLLNCLTDGQLVQTYVRTDTLNCGCSCDPATTTICGSVVNDCNLVAASGVTVTASGSEVVSTSTDSSGNWCLNFTKTGDYTITADGPCDSPSTSKTVTACGNNITGVTLEIHFPSLTITAKNPDCIGSVSSAKSVISGPGYPATDCASSPGSVFPSTYCVPGGDYTIEVCDDCYDPATETVSVACSDVSHELTLTSKVYNFTGVVGGCCATGFAGTEGATVVVSGTAGSWSGTTDVDGNFGPVPLKAQCKFTVTISKTNYETVTFPVTGDPEYQMPCNDWSLGSAFSISPAAGYQCLCCCDPVTDPLTVTDSQGTHSFYWSGSAYRTPCIVATGKTVYCRDPGTTPDCTTGTFTGSIAYYYLFTCNSSGITLTRYIPSCNDSLGVGHPLGSSCGTGDAPVVDPNGASCTYPSIGGESYLFGGEAVTQNPGFRTCGPLSVTFDFTFGFSDTATLNG